MKDFMKNLIKILEEHLEDCTIRENKVVKANNTELYALAVSHKDSCLARNIYVNAYYDEYKSGVSLKDIADKIISIASGREDEGIDEKAIIDILSSYEHIKDKLYLKIVSVENNESYLLEKCYKNYLDFALVVYVSLCKGVDGIMSTDLSKDMLKRLGVTLDEVYEQALDNTLNKQEYTIKSLMQMVLDKLELDEGDSEKLSYGNDYLYVASSKRNVNGAVVLLAKDILKGFADDMDVDEVIIIPSSVHEVLLAPKTAKQISEKECRMMLRDVNSTELAPEEMLSNNIYIYNRVSNEINIWNEE